MADRYTLDGEFRPISYEGREWFSLQPAPRMSLRPWQWLLAFTLGALSWGLVVAAVVVANSLHLI